jgi:protein tyrosine phosphatase (PTP) superfamily phosphohydrolase (DUF442 family)
MRAIPVLAVLFSFIALTELARVTATDLPGPSLVEAEGLHNVLRISDKIYSGSGPEGPKSFAALRRLGIKTVISVDGARPDVELARRHGLRYVHIPIGYNGVLRPQALQLAKAVRDLPGPVYVHCHHGKHRGPAAAAVTLLCADFNCTVEEALAVLRAAGTDPRYTGLFESVKRFERPTDRELARLTRELPEVVAVAALTQAMVGIDHAWDNLKLSRDAGWKAPPDHPDIDPPHEALQLQEQYRELARLPAVKGRPEDFRSWVAEGEQTARNLEKVLRVVKGKAVDLEAAEKAYRLSAATCTRCHTKYRDVPE